MTEEWRQVADFPGYAVSELGKVRRVCAHCGEPFGKRTLKQTLRRDGYLQVTLHHDDYQKSKQVHRLVCAAFHGPKPSLKHHAAHGDGNQRNNCADNLRWATGKENEADKVLHGTRARGVRQGAAKLTDDAVRAIRQDPRSQRAIASDYGVTQPNISIIKRREGWEHVQ